METSPRRALVVLLALSLGLTWAGWFPTAQGDPFPETVGRQVDVAPTDLLPSDGDHGDRPMVLSRGGILHAESDTRTEPVTVCAPFWFTGLAVTWEQPGRAEILTSVRISEDGETYTEPEQLFSDPGHAPDRGTEEFTEAQKGTPLLWTGGSRCARFTMDIPAGTSMSDIRVIFVNSSGSESGPGTAPLSPLLPASASAMTAEPDFVTREQWGAPNNPACGPYYADEVKMAFVHHTDGANRYSPSKSDDILRGILWYHVRGRNWCDIAYNFLIDRYGTTFEGRAGGMEEPVISGATQGVNTGSVSVALMGSYTRTSPTKPELAALKGFLAWRLDVAHVPPDARTTMTSFGGDNTWLKKGQSVRLNTISGHRDTGYTSCPGNRVFRRLKALRGIVADMGLPKIYYPSAEPTAPGTPPWKFKASGSTTMDWVLEVADAGGTIVRTLTQDDVDRMRVAWDGKDEGAVDALPGKYTVTIRGTNASRDARPAIVYAKIKAPVSPSP